MADQSGSTNEVLRSVLAGDTPALAEALAGGADADAADAWGVTALAHAAGRGDLEAVRVLLDKGAAADRPNRFGNTALMAAAAGGRDAVVDALLVAGADPAARNKWGLGPEDWARWPENRDDILALLRRGS